jgi:hypothetical protein
LPAEWEWKAASLRIAIFLLCAFDTLLWLILAGTTFFSQSDPATIGLDHAAGAVVTVLYAATALPALGLAWVRRAPRTSLALAIAFPAIFVLLFIAAIVAFA